MFDDADTAVPYAYTATHGTFSRRKRSPNTSPSTTLQSLSSSPAVGWLRLLALCSLRRHRDARYMNRSVASQRPSAELPAGKSLMRRFRWESLASAIGTVIPCSILGTPDL